MHYEIVDDDQMQSSVDRLRRRGHRHGKLIAYAEQFGHLSVTRRPYERLGAVKEGGVDNSSDERHVWVANLRLVPQEEEHNVVGLSREICRERQTDKQEDS